MRYIRLYEEFEKGNDIQCISWEDANRLLSKNSDFCVIDWETGKKWMMKRTSGKYHADVEPLTFRDSEIMLSCFPKDKTFEDATFRPVIIEIGLSRYGASLMGFAHCGSNETQFRDRTRILSGGFRNMRNWDSIRDNGIVGHFCLHFIGSLRHTDKMEDIGAQNEIMRIKQEK